MLSRRQFLGQTAGLSFLGLGASLPTLFVRAAQAAARADQNNHVLVVVELGGGNDGLNTVIPFENGLYYRYRPSLGIPKDQVIKLNDQLGLHPSLAPAGELFKSGKLAVVQGVGYPEPNRSHFRAMEIWHTASPATQVPDTGWLGRTLDYLVQPGDDRRMLGLTTSDQVPQLLRARQVTVPVFQQPGDEPPQQRLLNRLTSAASATDNDAAGFLRRQAAAGYRTADLLRKATSQFKPAAEYAGDLGNQFLHAAQVITADVGVRVVHISQGSYDTHNNQANGHAALLKELADGLAAFQQDLEKHRVADRVVAMTFSEFGRRVEENASHGTDHGAASCLFLTGTSVKGGFTGAYPGLEKLDDGDLIFNVDFRSVYATLLEKWLGCPADKLLGGKFPLLDLLRA